MSAENGDTFILICSVSFSKKWVVGVRRTGSLKSLCGRLTLGTSDECRPARVDGLIAAGGIYVKTKTEQ